MSDQTDNKSTERVTRKLHDLVRFLCPHKWRAEVNGFDCVGRKCRWCGREQELFIERPFGKMVFRDKSND